MITKVSTVNMPHEEWLARRKKSIGGSDAASVVGLNSFCSAYALWAEKTGRVPGFGGNLATEVGAYLEEFVAKKFEQETGKKVRKENAFIYNDEYPWAHANVDRVICNESALLEIKTTSELNMKSFKNGEYPSNYYAQCVHYLGITGRERCYLAVLIGNKEFKWFTIERDEAEIKALMAAENEFWQCVTNNIPPALDGSESTDTALKTIFAESTSREIDLTGVSNHIQMYVALTKQIKELEIAKAQNEAEIKSYMRDACKGSYGNTSISWKTQSRKNFDRAKYEQTYGAIPDSFFKESTSRPFKVTVKEI